MSTFGTLTLTYDTKIPKTPEELYEIYKQRNEIETMFDAYKNFLEADKTYMQNLPPAFVFSRDPWHMSPQLVKEGRRNDHREDGCQPPCQK
ncbi:hypothetical protein FACS1894126_6020 [Alphaproteobacteria bacterium]|nr:hypothetical protein FACS1894126_6020 [Alphaproteobacteria bacterium]